MTPKIEPMPLSTLLEMAHKRNPKEHDVPALVSSFARFGFVAMPTIDEATQIMVAGHGRCEALAAMKAGGTPPPRGVECALDGEWWVPVVRGIGFASEAERDAYVIADNQHTIHGGWNLDRLSTMLDEVRSVGFDGMGFNAVDLDSLLGKFTADIHTDSVDDLDDTEPEKFVTHDITVETTYRCPKCAYEWSGKAK